MVRMLDRVRTTLHKAITTHRGDSLSVVRVPKDIARRLNFALGLPICSAEELEKRRAAQSKLEELRRSGKTSERKELEAPVVVYFEKDRNVRELARIEELLVSKSIEFRKLDVSGDEATLSFVVRQANCKEDELPIVFVGATAIGPYNELVRADVSGALAKAMRGA